MVQVDITCIIICKGEYQDIIGTNRQWDPVIGHMVDIQEIHPPPNYIIIICTYRIWLYGEVDMDIQETTKVGRCNIGICNYKDKKKKKLGAKYKSTYTTCLCTKFIPSICIYV